MVYLNNVFIMSHVCIKRNFTRNTISNKLFNTA